MCAIDITAEQRKTVLALLARHLPNTTAWVYGSRVKWTARPQSDLDLVVFATPEQAGRVSDLREAFEESNLPFRMDLFVWDTVPEQFRKAIEAEHVVLVERRELGVGGEWSVDSVGDFFDLVTGYAFKSSDFADDGIPVIKIKNVKAGHFRKHQFSYVSPDFLDTRSEKIAQANDLLVSMSGNRHDGSPETWVGKVALFREEDAYLINQRVGALRLKRTAGLDAQFASFLLSSYPYQELFISIATSSGGQANLSPEQILGAPVRHPEIGEQRAIGHILGTLDDKIELNRRMNQTLETMARALFKSWFVDFDPVHAKATLKHHHTTPTQGGSDWSVERARAYLDRMAPNIAALFPDRFVDSELGPIPAGWGFGALEDVVELLSGGTPKTSVTQYWDGNIPWYTAKDAPSLSDVFVLETGRSITQAGVENSAAIILPTQTTIITARGTVGRLACLGRPMAMNQTCYGIRGARGYPAFFTYWNVRMTVDELRRRTHGTIFDTITRQTFKLVNSVIPPVELAGRFEKAILPVMTRILCNLNESRKLAAVRDTLLPKLLSGKVRVSGGVENWGR